MKYRPPVQNSAIDSEGTIHVPSSTVPFSALTSAEARQTFLDFDRAKREVAARNATKIEDVRRNFDEIMLAPGVERLRGAFDVDIVPTTIGGVPADVVTPASGIDAANSERVLVNLHGGGFLVGAGLGGQMESIPIAGMGRMKVISLDYRQAPEHHFPAASEDVASAYEELLTQYRPENIGIYGWSAGGWLTAGSVAWFQAHGIPLPGAIGLISSGALIYDGVTGDSAYSGTVLAGAVSKGKVEFDYFDVPGLDLNEDRKSVV